MGFALKSADRVRRIGVARSAPMTELRDINTPIARLRAIHPCLSLAQNRPKLPLRKPCFLAKPPQKLWHATVDSLVLRLRPHLVMNYPAELA